MNSIPDVFLSVIQKDEHLIDIQQDWFAWNLKAKKTRLKLKIILDVAHVILSSAINQLIRSDHYLTYDKARIYKILSLRLLYLLLDVVYQQSPWLRFDSERNQMR